MSFQVLDAKKHPLGNNAVRTFAEIETHPKLLDGLELLPAILVGFSTGTKLVRPIAKHFTAIGGLTATLFEIIIGGWLLSSPLI